MFMKFGRDEVFMALHLQWDVLAISAQADPGEAKIGWEGGGGNLAYKRSAYCTRVSN